MAKEVNHELKIARQKFLKQGRALSAELERLIQEEKSKRTLFSRLRRWFSGSSSK